MSAATLLCPPACIAEPPGRAGSYGDDVAEVAANVGRPFVPEQSAAMDALMAHDRRGRFLSVVAGIEGPRQTVGKSAMLLSIALWTAFTDPDDITWTAHLAETSQKQFFDLCGRDPKDDSGLIASCDWLRRRVRRVHYENGAEGVSFINGAHLGFRVRSAGRGRGMSGSTIFDDEFMFMTAEQVAAQAPVLATRSLHGNARAYRASSSAVASSVMLRELRRRAVAGDPTLTYVGWWAHGGWDDPGCESRTCRHTVDAEGCALDDEALWRSCNPLIDRLVSVEFLREMRRSMTPLGFGREFLGWQQAGDDDESRRKIRTQAWLDSEVDGRIVGPPRIGLAVSWDRSRAALVVAGLDAAGRVQVELVEYGRGTRWLKAAAIRLLEANPDARLGLVAGSAAAPVLDELAEYGARVRPLGSDEYVRACQDFADRVNASPAETVHRPDEDLDAAVTGTTSKARGMGGWVWWQDDDKPDVSPLIAATVAASMVERNLPPLRSTFG